MFYFIDKTEINFNSVTVKAINLLNRNEKSKKRIKSTTDQVTE